jgi:hypothetical protein
MKLLTKSLLRSLIISILFFLAAYINVSYFAILGAMVLFFYSIFLSFEQIMLIIFFLIPNISLITLEPRSPSLLGFIFIIILFKLIMQKKGKIKTPFFIIVLCILLCGLGLIRYFELNSTYDFLVLTKFCIMAICFIVFSRNINYERGRNVIMLFIYGASQMLFFAFLYALKMGSIHERLLAINNDSNYTGLTLAFSLSLIIILMVKKQKVPFSIPLFLFMLIGGIMTGSRAFLISFSFVVLATFILQFSENTKNKKTVWIVISMILLIYFVPIDQIQLYKEYLLNKFINPVHNDISGGRFDAWRYYIEIIFGSVSTFLFGIGMDNYWHRSGIGLVAHNQLIGSMVTIGVLGTLAVIFIQREIFISSRQEHRKSIKKGNLLNYIPLVTVIIAYMSLDGLANTNFSASVLLSGFVAIIFDTD